MTARWREGASGSITSGVWHAFSQTRKPASTTPSDVPTLRFVSGTAPYFHDGRYATLMDVLMASDTQMGHTMHLSRRDARALAAYLGTL